MKLYALILFGSFTLGLGLRCVPASKTLGDEGIKGIDQESLPQLVAGGIEPLASEQESLLCHPAESRPFDEEAELHEKLIQHYIRPRRFVSSLNQNPRGTRKELLHQFISGRQRRHAVPPDVYEKLINKTGTPLPLILPGLPPTRPVAGKSGLQELAMLHSERTHGPNPGAILPIQSELSSSGEPIFIPPEPPRRSIGRVHGPNPGLGGGVPPLRPVPSELGQTTALHSRKQIEDNDQNTPVKETRRTLYGQPPFQILESILR